MGIGRRVGRADARQRSRLRDPRTRAVEARSGDRPDRSDDRRPRAGADPRRRAAARARHASARQRGRPGGGAALPYREHLRARAARRPAPPSEVRARDAGAACKERCCRAACTSGHRSANPSDERRDPIAVVQFTAIRCGDPKGVRASTDDNMARPRRRSAALGMTDKTTRPVHVPLFHALRLGPRPSARARARPHDVPRGGDVAAADRQAAARADRRLLAGHALDVRRAGALPTIKPLQDERRALPRARARAARRPSPTASTRYGIRMLSCYHSTEAAPLALERAGKNPTTVGSADRGRRAARRRAPRATGCRQARKA